MGISSLLKFIKPFIKPVHIKKYAGKRVGIDAYSWLHKGAYSCSMELCLDSDSNKKSRYLQYFMHRINLLRHNNIIPVVVLDGANMPGKAATEHERHRKRKANLDLAMAKLKDGDVTAASDLFQRAVSITPHMAHQLIQILRSESIEFVVAPYEADAQLAYLSSLKEEKGGITAVITEDSDLMAYGCQAVIFKMDRYGNGEEILLDEVFDSVGHMPSFQKFDNELFTGMCVLAGCDFLPSVPGIGIGRAYSLVSKYRNLDRVLTILKFEKRNQMPEDYSKSFIEAVAVFHHARIYDADTKSLKLMKPLPPKLLESLDGELDFLGPDIPPSVASAIAEGKLNPLTMEAFDHFPTTGFHLNPIIFKAPDQLKRPKVAQTSTQESCFTTVSSDEIQAARITVMDERKCMNEAGALAKMVFHSQERDKVESFTKVSDKILVKFPNNNPFRKRKFAEVELDQVESIMVTEVCSDDNNPFRKRKCGQIELDNPESNSEQVSVVTEVCSDDNNLFRKRKCGQVELDNPESNSEQVSVVTEVCTDNHLLRKRKCDLVELDNLESNTEQVSVVTEVEKSNKFCVTLESQVSVGWKPNKISNVKTKIRDVKLKKRNCNGSTESKKSSILNFFSRV